eukprot:scaffold1314_cov158-Amphora_coffeaeformis.AAC.20
MDPETNSSKKKRQRTEAPADWHQPPVATGQPWNNHAFYHHRQGSVHPPRNAPNYGPPIPHPHGPWHHHPHVPPPPYMNPYDPRSAQMCYPNHPPPGYYNPAMVHPHHPYHNHAYPYPPPPPSPGYHAKHPPPPPSNPESTQDPMVNTKSKHPGGKAARPLREIWSESKGSAPGGSSAPVYSHRGPPPPAYPPQELCVPSLASPERRRNPMHIRDLSPWFRVKDLQQKIRQKQSKNLRKQSSDAKEGLYQQMNQQWQMLDQKLQYETVAIGALDSEQLPVFLSCLKDRDPLNYVNVGIALRCLKYLTAVESQRNAVLDTAIHEELIKLIEWPVASRVLGDQNIENIFQILAVLLEDEALLARAKLSNELLSKLSKVAASIWITWSKQESIVQLARRVLVAVNPDCDSHDEEEEDEEESSADDAEAGGGTAQLPQPTATHSKLDKPQGDVVPKEDIENRANV